MIGDYRSLPTAILTAKGANKTSYVGSAAKGSPVMMGASVFDAGRAMVSIGGANTQTRFQGCVEVATNWALAPGGDAWGGRQG